MKHFTIGFITALLTTAVLNCWYLDTVTEALYNHRNDLKGAIWQACGYLSSNPKCHAVLCYRPEEK